MNTFPLTEQPLAHFNLVCVSSTIVLERALQTLRYRGFELVTVNYSVTGDKEVTIDLVVKGQSKFATLKKSFEAIIEVKKCYLTEDQEKLATLSTIGQITNQELSNSVQQLAS